MKYEIQSVYRAVVLIYFRTTFQEICKRVYMVTVFSRSSVRKHRQPLRKATGWQVVLETEARTTFWGQTKRMADTEVARSTVSPWNGDL